jgi:asparagine synthetase B (glutamine-hydrolysing)
MSDAVAVFESLLRTKNFYWVDGRFGPSLGPDGGDALLGALAKIRGQFSLAWVTPQDELVLVRDRLGINKLFFALHESGSAVVANYLIDLVTRGVPFEAIYSVPSGHFLTIDLQQHRLSLTQYFDSRSQPWENGRGVTARAIREQLGLSFSRLAQQFGDRRIYVCLSGGLDSSLVAALAKQYFGEVMAYTYGYTEGNYLESEDAGYARKVAEFLRIPFRFVPASSHDVLGALEDALCYAQDWRDFNVHCAIVNELLARAIASDAVGHGDDKPPLVLTGDLMNEFLADYTPVSYNNQDYYRLPRVSPGEMRTILIRGLDAGDREVGIFNRYGIDVIQPYGLLLEQYLQLPESYLGQDRAKQRLAREIGGDLLPSFVLERTKVRAQIGSSTQLAGVLPVLIRRGYDSAWLRNAFCHLFKVKEETFLNQFIRAGRYRFISEFPNRTRKVDGYLAG